MYDALENIARHIVDEVAALLEETERMRSRLRVSRCEKDFTGQSVKKHVPIYEHSDMNKWQG